MKVRVKNYDAYLYVQVYRILEMCGGAVKRTEATGKYIKDEDVPHLPTGYLTASISTSLLKQPEFDLDVVSPAHFA